MAACGGSGGDKIQEKEDSGCNGKEEIWWKRKEEGNSKNRYVGLWYKEISVETVVWVANRELPLINTSRVLKVIKPGLLVLLDDTNGGIIWSSNTVTKLPDSGNLVVKDANDAAPGNFI
ncbi:Hypothetical predicted protein [Olea europaea subsp. europaea]|uniref:Bulb-type lectin domain-containing protein n=1 Tax=Olea europaea subsp. europaea TaxID=158383 RepID=A0A8S0QK74_OLEEU|nr:Hypothetical predicted protein [Olea europaea subsp. europaea]